MTYSFTVIMLAFFLGFFGVLGVMHFVCDENLSCSEYFFSSFGAITTRAGRLMTQNDLEDADVLLVRSVTRVTPALLKHTPVKFVGSATIGTDHLDLDGLKRAGVTVVNAAGCNAQAVAEYVITAMLTLRPHILEQVVPFRLGIIGLGNVGVRLAHLAQQLGFVVIGCDPWVERSEITQVDLQTLVGQVDAVSVHVPLIRDGEHPTYHLINQEILAAMPTQTMLINSSRGAVVEEAALMADLAQHPRQVVLDVFEHEPEISEALLSKLALATPHIAGYSLEGKVRGTAMIYEQFCQWRGVEVQRKMADVLPVIDSVFRADQPLKTQVLQHLMSMYDIRRDDAALRSCLQDGVVDATAFDHLRKAYPLRREWAAYGASW